jgi:hypothetical protein
MNISELIELLVRMREIHGDYLKIITGGMGGEIIRVVKSPNHQSITIITK